MIPVAPNLRPPRSTPRRRKRSEWTITIHDLIVLVGSKDAADTLGVSHSWLKRWMRQNLPEVTRCAK